MLKLKKVAVTGTVASGKSSVCRILERYGAYVISADNIVHEFLKSDKKLGKQVIQLLGSDILVGDGIDRARVARKVFTDDELLQKLEMLIHPKVKKEIHRLFALKSKENKYSLLAAEIPLLFECGWENDYDTVIAVIAEELICKKRFLASGQSEAAFYERNNRMLSADEKVKRADFGLTNNGTLEELEQKTKTIITFLEANDGKRNRK